MKMENITSVEVTLASKELKKGVSMRKSTGHSLALWLKLILQEKINSPSVFAFEDRA